MILPPHKNALLSGEGGESGCWQEKLPLPLFGTWWQSGLVADPTPPAWAALPSVRILP